MYLCKKDVESNIYKIIVKLLFCQILGKCNKSIAKSKLMFEAKNVKKGMPK
ncbi:MAG: hypothetical protein RSD09_07195 [Bacilli bacterium]